MYVNTTFAIYKNFPELINSTQIIFLNKYAGIKANPY